MRVFLFLIFLFTLITNTNAQSITLKVLGSSTYTEHAEVGGIRIHVSDEKSKNKLIDTLASIGLINSLKEIKKAERIGRDIRNKEFLVEERDLKLFNKLLMMTSGLPGRILIPYYIMPEHKFEDEDMYAILALDNAKSKATIIATHLKYKIVKILNVDDETTFADPFWDKIDLESEHGKIVVKLLTLLSHPTANSKEPTRERGYNIWVTYELKPI